MSENPFVNSLRSLRDIDKLTLGRLRFRIHINENLFKGSCTHELESPVTSFDLLPEPLVTLRHHEEVFLQSFVSIKKNSIKKVSKGQGRKIYERRLHNEAEVRNVTREP